MTDIGPPPRGSPSGKGPEVAAYLGIAIAVGGAAISKWILEAPGPLVASGACAILFASFTVIARAGHWRTLFAAALGLCAVLSVGSTAAFAWHLAREGKSATSELVADWQHQIFWESDPLGPNRTGHIYSTVTTLIDGVATDSSDGTTPIQGHVGTASATQVEISVSGRRHEDTVKFTAPPCTIGSVVPVSAVDRSGKAVLPGRPFVSKEKGYILLSQPNLPGYQDGKRNVVAIGLIGVGEPLTIDDTKVLYDEDCYAYVYVRRVKTPGIGWIRIDSLERSQAGTTAEPTGSVGK